MPSDEDNVQYLYLVLTQGGPPTVDWDAVTTELSLKKGATLKRWSRLKKTMVDKTAVSPDAYRFLWLCVKHSTRDEAMDWTDIAEQCGTTAGAASKRYSRMKQAFDNGTAQMPAAPTPKEKTPSTPKAKTPAKPKANAKATNGDAAAPETKPSAPKRKRGAATAAKAKSDEDVESEGTSKQEQEHQNGDTENDEEQEKPKAKRVRAMKKKPTTSTIKSKANVRNDSPPSAGNDPTTSDEDRDLKPKPKPKTPAADMKLSLLDELETAIHDAQAMHTHTEGAVAVKHENYEDTKFDAPSQESQEKVQNWLEETAEI